MLSPKIPKGSLTLAGFMQMSLLWYRSVDDKRRRARMDVVGARITLRQNYNFNKSSGAWERDEKKAVKITFLVTSRPKSYKIGKKSPQVRKYPITWVIDDLEQGLASTFKIREGSMKKPKFAKLRSIPKRIDAAKKRKLRLANRKIRLLTERQNIKNGVQLQSFFQSQWVQNSLGILVGPCYANRAPKVTNPKRIPFMSKHSFYVFTKVLAPLISGAQKQLLINKLYS